MSLNAYGIKPSPLVLKNKCFSFKTNPRLHLPPIMANSSSTVASTPPLTLSEIPERYDALLLDQFGVLHDGTTPYENAIAAVEYLHSRGVQMLIISNSSRRASGALGNLAKMGFPIEAFSGVITSGEVTHRHLTTRPTDFWHERQKAIHFTWADRGAISVEGLGIDIVQNAEDADFILAHGTEALGTSADGTNAQPKSLEELKDILKQCAAASGKSLPLVVANPDVVTVHGSELRTMPGTFARWYKEFGGEVHLMGKPSPVIYQGALEMLQGIPHDKVLAVGDSLEHDIAGASSANIDSVLIAGGIHKAELLPGGASPGNADLVISDQGLRQLYSEYNTAAKYVMPYFEL